MSKNLANSPLFRTPGRPNILHQDQGDRQAAKSLTSNWCIYVLAHPLAAHRSQSGPSPHRPQRNTVLTYLRQRRRNDPAMPHDTTTGMSVIISLITLQPSAFSPFRPLVQVLGEQVTMLYASLGHVPQSKTNSLAGMTVNSETNAYRTKL